MRNGLRFALLKSSKAVSSACTLKAILPTPCAPLRRGWDWWGYLPAALSGFPRAHLCRFDAGEHGSSCFCACKTCSSHVSHLAFLDRCKGCLWVGRRLLRLAGFVLCSAPRSCTAPSKLLEIADESTRAGLILLTGFLLCSAPRSC